ncbi:2-oxo acid dehydrogenase subunit E2 [Dasania sp. GY-MA-18]|uniref:Dihydrolipoamide acetyltransferase component of pyruvate dehydrogenase complex n=1 Tax=Dasania phycosphaerae TaxID=2950436 RepID=A0A9J6RQN5_9GAMM|nr:MULTISPECIES: dihydrolipoamide acetyltransferase family protein [Dasania]MCR8924036.1 2-oxo acid dehydrogenase subunit E2 [Dasania sp. GY-MA-18]MCZ0866609.1 dihydrolipoamide acetyltransferase family protein [Dasania phycosphaerae]MCZ0870194.1 dihydrolipoamide acetyltransferase family protein [Dasania phycosphaerae]
MSTFSFKLPDLGEGIVESEIVAWHIAVGDEVSQDQHIADVQTDKAVIEATSPISGTVVKLGCQAGEVLAVGSELVLFDTQGTASATATSTADTPAASAKPQAAATPQPAAADKQAVSPSATTESSASQQNDSAILTSPSVRLRARQHNIDLHSISGSGPKGRINHSDLDRLIHEPKANSATAASTKTTASNALPNTPKKSYPLTGTRRIIAKKLQQAAQQIPHYSYVEEVDVSQLEQLRQQLNQQHSHHKSKLTLLPFIIQALLKSLPQFPHCNAHFNNDSNEVTEYQAVHMGIATMTDQGLMVPVIEDCQSLDMWECAARIEQLADAARNHQIKPSQLSGSTITLSSLGKLGGIAATPIINAPETCIIAINKIQRRPVVVDEAIAIRSIMNLSASFDHRIVDGYDGASLVQAIKKLLEQPEMLINP